MTKTATKPVAKQTPKEPIAALKEAFEDNLKHYLWAVAHTQNRYSQVITNEIVPEMFKLLSEFKSTVSGLEGANKTFEAEVKTLQEELTEKNDVIRKMADALRSGAQEVSTDEESEG